MFFDILKHEIIAKFFDSTVCLKITLIQKFDGNMETQIGSALVQFIHMGLTYKIGWRFFKIGLYIYGLIFINLSLIHI